MPKFKNSNATFWVIFKHCDLEIRSWKAKVLIVGWNGMISNLLDHSADMIAASLTMSGERFEVVDYLPPIGMETYTIVIKAVDSEEISWLTFKRPLRYETWIFMVALALIFTFTIHLSGKLLMMENKTGLEVNEHFMTHLILDLFTSIQFAFPKVCIKATIYFMTCNAMLDC